MALSQEKLDLIEHYKEQGWQIINGTNNKLNQAKKWQSYHLVKLVHSGGRKSGSYFVVWAVKPKVNDDSESGKAWIL